MKIIGAVAGVCVVATALGACGGGGGGAGTSKNAKVVSGGTFTTALSTDPGNLDPQMTANSATLQVVNFAYDTLIHIDLDGRLSPQLASAWKVSGSTVTFTMRSGVTCSDGSTFTARDAASNLNYVTNPKNKSPLTGAFAPPGATATASGSTVTLKLASPSPFVLNGLANIPMVCKAGLANRSTLATKTDGTGLFKLTEDVASDHIAFTKRTGYTWGPLGVTSSTPGLPDKVVIKFVSSLTTAANLLLSGGLSAATVTGPDAKRLQGAGLFAAPVQVLLGEMWFNHAKTRPGSDLAVRKALTQAVDLTQLAKVMSSGEGTAATTFATAPPVACTGNSIQSALPPHGVDQAKATLEAAGWKVGAGGTRSKNGQRLALTFIYDTAGGSSASAAAELAASVWKTLGAAVTMRAQSDTEITQTVLGGSGNWDVGWLPLNVSSPDQLVPFMSGPSPTAGNNFGQIDNPAYAAEVARATTKQGKAGCADWLAAESQLVKNADVIPFANQSVRTFAKGARFAAGFSAIDPTTIRMTTG
ncbi:ABC transporter substrate-binding protein [Allobranchiibius huperziae]|uniref:Peptide/nickel transport system substrate-binding protein n=1 Tax=Allobranchiibius huperziae TaxID=1874116 RepID=A0A853DL85_9MICO|nr:ABC transporter substrate-binding protein [Allobranchiibius huperziae]NYJ74905.1 peptide/nickel transport system substrate-binding protein [Allobranchiibius huperziae]